MARLRFRAPGTRLRLAALLDRAVPGATREQRRSWVETHRVRIQGRPARELAAAVAPGLRVELDLPTRARPRRGDEDTRLRARGSGWEVYERTRAPASEVLGGPPRGPDGGEVLAGQGSAGLVLVAHGAEAVRRLAEALTCPDSWLEYRALTPEVPWPRGTVHGPAGRGEAHTTFRVLRERRGVAELALENAGGGSPMLRRHAEMLGAPVLGDPLHGGILVAGGLRLRLVAVHVPREAIHVVAAGGSLAWPEEPLHPPAPERAGAGSPRLRVSPETLAALARGHPWVRPDAASDDAGRFRAGAVVRITGRGASRETWFGRAEGSTRIAARVWGRGREVPAIEARVARALDRRAVLLAAAETDAYRLVHGEADGLPGLCVDRFGPLLRMVVTGRAGLPLREPVIDALFRRLAPQLGSDVPVVEVIHLQDRPPGSLECVRWLRGSGSEPMDGSGRWVVHERGLRFLVDPGLARPDRPSPAVGFFPDQRDNRERLARRARRGGRWLNLFAHTGGFSLALLAGGAHEVISVDLSGAYQRWLDDNLVLNGMARGRHRSVRMEARRFVERLGPEERFAGIVIDPPTAAGAGRRFWSVRRDFPPLLAACLAHLEPGGVLLACRNDRGGRGALASGVRQAARAASARLRGVLPAPPGVDFPALPGFPEGDPFAAILAERAR